MYKAFLDFPVFLIRTPTIKMTYNTTGCISFSRSSTRPGLTANFFKVSFEYDCRVLLLLKKMNLYLTYSTDSSWRLIPLWTRLHNKPMKSELKCPLCRWSCTQEGARAVPSHLFLFRTLIQKPVTISIVASACLGYLLTHGQSWTKASSVKLLRSQTCLEIPQCCQLNCLWFFHECILRYMAMTSSKFVERFLWNRVWFWRILVFFARNTSRLNFTVRMS